MDFIDNFKRRDIQTILALIAAIVLLCWVYLIRLAVDMQAMLKAMPNMPLPVWDTGYALMMFFMWAIMMVGMMLPSVIPAVMIYASIVRKAEKDERSIAPTVFFIAGYLFIWLLFSVAATGLQYALQVNDLLSPMMKSNNALFGASLLIIAGLYQWLPIKDVCLRHCRSPIEFISEHWRTGKKGALLMGAHHGLYCVGCCWLLMSLLFFGGVMNLLWIAALTIFVLLEKTLPWGHQSARFVGILMVLSGSGLLYLNHFQ